MEAAPAQQTTTQVLVNSFIRSVYNWMAIGLAITGLMAYYVSQSSIIKNIIFIQHGNMLRPSLAFWIIAIAEVGLVFTLAGRLDKLKASTSTALFMLYALLNGVTLSVLFIAYTMTSIASTFFICSATFGACSIYGMVTKRDLTGLGQFMRMGFIGIFIATIINIFIGSYGMHMIISYLGVIIFTGLTAYDTQQLKHMALSQPAGLDNDVIRKGAIFGALKLYLDFILMFQFLMNILGVSRD